MTIREQREAAYNRLTEADKELSHLSNIATAAAKARNAASRRYCKLRSEWLVMVEENPGPHKERRVSSEPIHRLTSPLFDRRPQQEQFAILAAMFAAENFGYGNIIAHLATAWATKLREEGLDEETAIAHVSGRSPYLLRRNSPA